MSDARPTSAAFLTLALMLLPLAPLHAQDAGAVRGTVTNEQGEPVSAAQIYIEELGIGTLTRADGQYLLGNIDPGTHTVNVSIIGYRPVEEEIRIPAGGTATLDFILEQDLLNLESVVVTATRAPRTKLESSSAVTNVPQVEIAREQPRSTADLMKVIPGFYVESSGGEVGGNLFARGLPADGSFRYVALMEENMPVYDATELFFVNSDIFIRVDENLERLEGVRGGNSALFGSNAPGGVINFISYTGGPELSGALKSQIGTDGLARIDGNVNGPISEDWRFSVGGFYRYDEGLRDPGFPASRGGQIKANITRLFENGHFRLYGKWLNDRNIFYLPVPFRNPEDPELVAGFPDDGTLTSPFVNYAGVPLPTGEQLTLPLEDGQRQVGGSIIADLVFDLGEGWELQNLARFMDMDHQWNAMPPVAVQDAEAWAQSFVDATPGATDYELTYAGTGETFTAGENGLIATSGLWHVDKPLRNFSNQLQVQKLITETGMPQRLTIGAYFGHYEAGNTWYFNDVVTEVAGAPRPLDLTLVDAAGNTVRQVTDNGFTRYLSNYTNAQGNATIASLYAGDEIELTDALRLDIGARYEWNQMEQFVEGTETVDLGGPTDADDQVLFGDRTRTHVSEDFGEWAASVGLNYLLSDNLSVYARGSRGYKMPILDQFMFATDPEAEGYPDVAETLYQVEGGMKMSSRRIGLSAVAYWLSLRDFPSQDAQVVDGETVFVTRFAGEARTLGLELEAVSQPIEGLTLNGTATLQKPEYEDFVSGGEDFTGNRVRRIPQVLLGLDAGYQLPLGLVIGGEWNYVGMRYSNTANTVELPAFSYTNGRLEYLIPESGLTVQLGILNAFNSHGLTEGNPRVDETVGAQSTLFLARPILPRRITLSARYGF